MILAQCPVCQEMFTTAGCSISALPCGHVFHKECVDRWFTSSCTCPQCRVNVRKSSIVARLFFDVADYPSTSSTHEPSRNSSQSTICPTGEKDLPYELFRVREENSRLEGALRDSEHKCRHNLKLANDCSMEVITLTARHLESEERAEKERKRCNELRAEVAGLRKFLSDAEAMQAEAIRLRNEMDDMQNIKKLISVSEEDALGLLRRYSIQRDDAVPCNTNGRNDPRHNRRQSAPDAICNLQALCRWTAALRTELTSSRVKARSYRIETSRLRKMHTVALQRATKGESISSRCQEELKRAEETVATLTRLITHQGESHHHNHHTQCALHSGDQQAVQSRNSISEPDLFSPATNYSTIAVAHGSRKPKQLSTPDLLTFSPSALPSSVELKLQLRTPAGNPFSDISGVPFTSSLLEHPSCSTHHPRNTRTPTVKATVQPSTCTATTGHVVGNNTRRSSGLFEMAIMRRHMKQSFRDVHVPQPPTASTSRTLTAYPPAPVSRLYTAPSSSATAVKRRAQYDANKNYKHGGKYYLLDKYFHKS